MTGEAHDALPCLRCPLGAAAMREVIDAYLQARRGGPPPERAKDGRIWPERCCRRRAMADVATLIA